MEQNAMGAQNTPNGTQFGTVNPGAGMSAEPVETAEPAVAPADSGVDEKKKSQGTMIALILCLILALGGIGFGVFMMMDKNSQVDRLNKQIATLQSQNADLTNQVAELTEKIEGHGEAKMWGSTEVEDGVFYVKDENGNVLAKSEIENLEVIEIISCDESDEDTVLKCTVNTSEGEGWFLYDVYGDSLSSSFDEEEPEIEPESNPETE